MKKILILLSICLPFLGYGQALDLSQVVRPNNSTPIISITTTSIALGSVNVGSASTSQPFQVSGTALTGSVTITPPATFVEMSLDNMSFSTSAIVLSQSGGAIISQPITVWIRMPSTAPVAAYSNPINLTSPGAGTKQITVTGTVNPLTPNITVSTNSLTGFITTAGTASTAQTYTLGGTNLTANITVTAPTGYEVGLNGVSFAGLQTVVPSGGTASATVSVRLLASNTAGTYTGTPVSNVSSGAASQNVAVSGTVNPSGGGAGDTARFMLALTSHTTPAGFVMLFGDPSTGIRTATNVAGTISISTVATTNWGPLSGASAGDAIGMTGSTITGFPDNILQNGMYTYSDGSNLSDSASLGLAKPQFKLSGLNTAGTYHIEFTANLDNTRFALTCANKLRVWNGTGLAQVSTVTINELGNKTVKIVMTGLVPSAGGNLNIYINTEPGQEIALASGIVVWRE